jgi:hypothetical protein
MRTIVGVALIFAGCCEAFGQSAPAPRAFDVASIKPRQAPIPRINISTSGPRLIVEGYTVFRLILEAYNLKNHQVSFGNFQVDDRGSRSDPQDELRRSAVGSTPYPRGVASTRYRDLVRPVWPSTWPGAASRRLKPGEPFWIALEETSLRRILSCYFSYYARDCTRCGFTSGPSGR